MRERLEEALKTHDVEYADIRIEELDFTHVSFRGPELDAVGSARTVGGIVRALYRGGWGYATFNDLEGLNQRVRDACRAARLVGSEQTHFAPVEPVVDANRAELGVDFRYVPLADKVSLADEYNRIVLGYHPSIQTSALLYADSFRHITLATSEGAYVEDEQPDVYVFALATARSDDTVQTCWEAAGGPQGYETVTHFHEGAEQAAATAVALLSAPPITGGTYTVIADPFLAGVFAHEAFGHLSESDFVYENDRLQELMVLGRRFGSDSLSIVDDGSLPGGLATHRYDCEGTPTGKHYLIKEGLLVGRLHSRETAAKMGEQPTGNARAVAFHHPPIVRMTNTYIEPGTATLEEMIKDIPLGVIACKAFGGETAMEMFTFSAAYGRMIRNGAVAELVRNVVLTGNVFTTLANIDAIGSQMTWGHGGPGGCGKGGQDGLRVGAGGPYVRIQNCVVGGRQ
jgi:TldD protein